MDCFVKELSWLIRFFFLYILTPLFIIFQLSLYFTENCLGLRLCKFTQVLIGFMIVYKTVAVLVLPSEIFQLRWVGQSSPGSVDRVLRHLLILAYVQHISSSGLRHLLPA